MKKLLTLLFCVLLIGGVLPSALGSAQQRNVYKLRIRHADPALIYRLLRGMSDTSTEPETSSRPRPGGYP